MTKTPWVVLADAGYTTERALGRFASFRAAHAWLQRHYPDVRPQMSFDIVWRDPAPEPPRYSAAAVDSAIAQSNRAGRRIGKREARLIHALLKGRDG